MPSTAKAREHDVARPSTWSAVRAPLALCARCALCALCASLTARAQGAPADSAATARPPAVRAVRLREPMNLDGALDEAVWREAPPVTRFVQQRPNEAAAPTESSEVRVAFDDEALYVGGRFYDTAPDSVIARLARRDVDAGSDGLIVYLDSYHDRRTGFYFGVSASGVLYDGTMLNDDWNSDSWDGVWDARVKRDAQGYTVEMKIPFSQLRFQSGARQVWGINFKRVIGRRNEEDLLVITPRSSSGFVSRFPDLEGLDGIVPPRRVAVAPYATGRAEYQAHDTGDPFHDGSSYLTKYGADFKLGLGSNLTLDGTVNPDFGQVEVDPAVVNLSDVETFYPEKRPFFLEGDNVFRFGNNGASDYWNFNWWEPLFFYTRRIGRAPAGSIPDADFSDVPLGTTILGAGKLTGVVGKWNTGVVGAATQKEMADLSKGGNQWRTEVEPLTYYGVARAARPFNDGRQGLGFMGTYTARDFSESRLETEMNREAGVVGMDGWTFLDKNKTWVISGYTAATRAQGSPARIVELQRSSTHYYQRPDAGYLGVDSTATHLDGAVGRLWINKEKGNVFANAAIGAQSPGFDVNDLGFFGYGDVVNAHVGAGYKWTKAGKVKRYANWGGALFRRQNFGGVYTGGGVASFGYVEFTNFYTLDLFGAYNPEWLSDRQTRGGPLMVAPPGGEWNATLGTDSRKRWRLTLGTGWGQYERGSQLYWNVSPTLSWHASSSLLLSFSPSYSHAEVGAQYVDTYVDPLATGTYGNRYVFAHLDQNEISGGMRVDWTFTPRLSLQIYAQPLVSVGDYSDFKELSHPRSYEFLHYGTNGSTYDPVTGTVDPDGPGGPAPAFVIDNPDFNVRSLRGSAVLRWEYLPGSSLYLVWTQSRSKDTGDPTIDFSHSFGSLGSLPGENIFMIKLSYWWSP